MKIRHLLVFLLLLPCRANGQGGSTARTNGNCSPAISNSTVGKLTITCSSVSPATAEQLVHLMNRILQEHIDPDMIYKKLGELQTQVGSLDAAMNPLAHAAPKSAELATRGEQLYMSCMNLTSRWLSDDSRMQKLAADNYESVRGRLSLEDYTKQLQKTAAVKWEPVYNSELRGKLIAWRSEILAAEPSLASEHYEIVPVHSLDELSDVCTSVVGLEKRYYDDLTHDVQMQSAKHHN